MAEVLVMEVGEVGDGTVAEAEIDVARILAQRIKPCSHGRRLVCGVDRPCNSRNGSEGKEKSPDDQADGCSDKEAGDLLSKPRHVLENIAPVRLYDNV